MYLVFAKSLKTLSVGLPEKLILRLIVEQESTISVKTSFWISAFTGMTPYLRGITHTLFVE